MKNIVVNIAHKSSLYDEYSGNVSKNLIDYLITEAKYANDDIKIIINTKLDLDDIESFIKNGLKKAYARSRKFEKIYNNKQVMFFIIGVLFLILSTFVLNNDIIEEIIIIAGWVAIWEVVDISLNVDSELKISRKLIKRLLNSEIVVNKNEDIYE